MWLSATALHTSKRWANAIDHINSALIWVLPFIYWRYITYKVDISFFFTKLITPLLLACRLSIQFPSCARCAIMQFAIFFCFGLLRDKSTVTLSLSLSARSQVRHCQLVFALVPSPLENRCKTVLRQCPHQQEHLQILYLDLLALEIQM